MKDLKYRYRTNWRGKLILQVIYLHDAYAPEPYKYRWRDATVEDITRRENERP